MSAPDQACHDLLVRLAGRLPDDLLWRLRDWLADGGRAALSATLPRELLRHRVGLTDDERDLLVASVGEWGAQRRLLDTILPSHGPDELFFTFEAVPDGLDPAALSLAAVVRGHPGCVELRQSRRTGGRGRQRVVLVSGGERPWVLTGVLQRVLRAHGDRTPCVEVLPPHGEPPAYHQAVIIGSASLWHSPAELVGA
ncbi:hypothetical protein [Pseudonocardia xinjiangensis]|uniref:Uncharacterized protein n=1 Tax=Pseudonocardia xinjiangensis TaxID=75289 RepID=A0ABX1R9A0_9PSEU|nr:hypothetical protein [Pseudonocardia xinjiangensis]NMH76947.1 hypothetical protein [Pseudonocardia xinjiangensis]